MHVNTCCFDLSHSYHSSSTVLYFLTRTRKVGPLPNFNFTYGTTLEHCWAGALGNAMNFGSDVHCKADYNQVSRNLTNMKLNVRTFLSLEKDKKFFLYVGFGDVHRCRFQSAIGSFCEYYGSGMKNKGTYFPKLTDWPKPTFYSPSNVIVPPYLPDVAAVREDLAGQYTAWDRLDAGVGVIVKELENAKVFDNTLVIFFSDNGIPFPGGKTNLFEQGQHEPLIISSPKTRKAKSILRSSELIVSALDLAPTILDWAGIVYPSNARARGLPAHLTGSSLLPLLLQDISSGAEWRDAAFASHQFHSLYAYYPMRSMVTTRFLLIHNLNYNLKYPILEDVYNTQTWSDIEEQGENGNDHPGDWIMNYTEYMFRPEWQLFDVTIDPLCLENLALNMTYSQTLNSMQASLQQWQKDTADPWLGCNPSLPNQAKEEEWSTTHSEICSF